MQWKKEKTGAAPKRKHSVQQICWFHPNNKKERKKEQEKASDHREALEETAALAVIKFTSNYHPNNRVSEGRCVCAVCSRCM